MTSAMKPPDEDQPGWSSAVEAKVRVWDQVRRELRWRLIRALSLSLCYLLAAFAVGAYLLQATGSLLDEDFLDSLPGTVSPEQLISFLLVAYAIAAVVLLALMSFCFLTLFDRLPAGLQPVAAILPSFGSATSSLSLSAFWSSFYRSVTKAQPYETAFETASRELTNPAMRKWASLGALWISRGHGLEEVFVYAPLSDCSTRAAAALLKSNRDPERVAEVVERAASGSHQLAYSRVLRTSRVIFATGILGSAIVSLFALSGVIYLTYDLIRGLYWW